MEIAIVEENSERIGMSFEVMSLDGNIEPLVIDSASDIYNKLDITNNRICSDNYSKC